MIAYKSLTPPRGREWRVFGLGEEWSGSLRLELTDFYEFLYFVKSDPIRVLKYEFSIKNVGCAAVACVCNYARL